MLQQINLYKEPVEPIVILSIHQMIIINIILISLLFMISIYKLYDFIVIERKFKNLQMKHANLNKGLATVKKSIPTEEYKKNLAKNLTMLQQNKENNKKMFVTLQNINYKETVNFSKYLSALAQPEISYMWLNKFHFTNSGENIVLEGIVIKNSSILQYLQDLSENKIFMGKTFDKLQMIFDEKNKQMKFIVGSS